MNQRFTTCARVVVASALLLLAGAGVAGTIRVFRGGELRKAAAPLAVAFGVAVLANGPWQEVSPMAPAEAPRGKRGVRPPGSLGYADIHCPLPESRSEQAFFAARFARRG